MLKNPHNLHAESITYSLDKIVIIIQARIKQIQVKTDYHLVLTVQLLVFAYSFNKQLIEFKSVDNNQLFYKDLVICYFYKIRDCLK